MNLALLLAVFAGAAIAGMMLVVAIFSIAPPLPF